MDTSARISTESTLPAPVLIVEDDPLIQNRLERVLVQ